MGTAIIEVLKNWVITALNFFLGFLPDCPFEKYIEATSNSKYLKWLNWFIPIDDFIAIGSAWLVAIGIFYIYQIMLRWLKAIGS